MHGAIILHPVSWKLYLRKKPLLCQNTVSAQSVCTVFKVDAKEFELADSMSTYRRAKVDA